MQKTHILYLLYRRLRVGLGILGFILMYGALTDNFSAALLKIGAGFALIELFGAFYNDYQDFELDARSARKDKWTTSGLVTKTQMRNIAGATVLGGIWLLQGTSTGIILLGAGYALALFAYSYPGLPLGRNIPTYIILSALYLLLIPAMVTMFQKSLAFPEIYLTMFCFFQSIYILSQKDSTDTTDNTNIFLRNWNVASLTCAISAIFSLSFLFLLSSFRAPLMLFWGVNLLSKWYLVSKIIGKELTSTKRSRIMLIEFLTPYAYIAGGL